MRIAVGIPLGLPLQPLSIRAGDRIRPRIQFRSSADQRGAVAIDQPIRPRTSKTAGRRTALPLGGFDPIRPIRQAVAVWRICSGLSVPPKLRGRIPNNRGGVNRQSDRKSNHRKNPEEKPRNIKGSKRTQKFMVNNDFSHALS